MKTMNKVMLIAGLMMGAQASVAGMDLDFDFGVVAAPQIDATLAGHIKSVGELASVDATTLKKAIDALVASNNEDVAFALAAAVVRQLAALNTALEQLAVNHKDLMQKGIFTLAKTAVTGKTTPVAKAVQEVLTAWFPILQATISTALLKKQAEELGKKLHTVEAVRLQIAQKEQELTSATVQAKTTYTQASTATRNMADVENELTQRLALMDAATNATTDACTAAGQKVRSAK